MRVAGEIIIIALGALVVAAWTILLPSVGVLCLLGFLK